MTERFLKVTPADEARRAFFEAVRPAPLGTETVALSSASGRILADDVASPVDVPGFDRANMDGFAVRAEDTFGADENSPRALMLSGEEVRTGRVPQTTIGAGHAIRIATGGMLPRGADAVVMVEHAQVEDGRVSILRAATPGANVSFSGSDIARQEIVARRGTLLSARETGTLAAVGVPEVEVFTRPRVAVFSTGDELVPPGETLRTGQIFDSNLTIVKDSLRELGCEPVDLGVVKDDLESLQDRITDALSCDVVLFSGGTSKGRGDHAVAAVESVGTIICHGVAVKPGKPLCLAVAAGKPLVVLPGFPTSAVFTFHEFVAPLLRILAGAPPDRRRSLSARVPFRINSERGRTEFLLVTLFDRAGAWVAYPMGKGSGSVTSFSRADGFITLARQQEYVEAEDSVQVTLLAARIRPADLTFIGSHCIGLEALLNRLSREGYSVKTLFVGSHGGLRAADREECDLAGIHLCNERGEYNTPFIGEGMTLIRGYRRQQGVVFRDREPDLMRARMVNRNRGSGTRILIDELLGGRRPPGYSYEARSHNAVAAAVAQSRADWGIAIEAVAEQYGLRFRPLREERYDFVAPTSRLDRDAVRAFQRILQEEEMQLQLQGLRFACTPSFGRKGTVT